VYVWVNYFKQAWGISGMRMAFHEKKNESGEKTEKAHEFGQNAPKWAENK